MVKINKIYTKTGDKGTTGLASGERRRKDDARIIAYGAVDECNSAIGIARLHASPQIDSILSRIQNEMFDLGADLATPDLGEDLGYEPLRIIASQTLQLEKDIDMLNAELRPLTSFILPAGTAVAAHLHLARTIARRAEQNMVTLSNKEKVSEETLKYINRLSDFLFCAARYCNKEVGDVLWVAGATR